MNDPWPDLQRPLPADRVEERFRDLAELSSDWFWEQDAEFRFTALWGETHARTRLNVPTTVGRRRWELGIAGVSEEAWQAHRAALQRREVFRDFTYPYVNEAGELRWLSVSGKPVFDAAGRFTGYRGIGRDITERRQAEQALRDSAAQLRLITDSAPASIGYFDRDLVLRFLNRGFEQVWGRPATDLLGRPLRELVSAVTYRQIEGHFAQALRGEPVSYRRLGDKPGAEAQILNVSLVPHRDENGAVIGCYGVAMDVTASEHAQERIRALELRFASALETTTDLMAVYRVEDGEPVIEQFNPALRIFYEQRFGMARFEDWIGRPLKTLMQVVAKLAPEATERRLAAFRRAIATGQVMRYRSAIESPAGIQQRDALLVPITDAAGLVTHLFYRGADITESVEQQAQLERLNAELERKVSARTEELSAANRELEAFAYSVSHDLRAPLRGIDGFSKLLMESHAESLDADGMAYLQRIRKGILRMGALIDDLLRISRVTRGQLKRENVDLSAMTGEIAADLQRQAIGRKVEWRIEPGVTVSADAGLMRLVLENLLGNAWKYTRDTVVPVIEFGAAASDGGVEFHVRDNGAGFDMAYADKLFQPFQRLHGAREFEGTGIGLATVARAVHRHGGRVRGFGEPGRGAVIHVFLPDPGEGE